MAVKELLVSKSDIEKSNLKAEAISKSFKDKSFSKNEYKVDIISISKIEGGVEVMARAFKNGKQLGFGADGSVDIERFRFFNPPIMIPDGTKVMVPAKGIFPAYEIDGFVENPKEALRLILIDTIKSVGIENSQIVKDKVGKTTATFYPSAGASSPVDGNVGNSNVTWAGCRSSATGTGASATSTTDATFQAEYVGVATLYAINRSEYCFDTSTIGSGQTISAATFSVFSTGASDQSETTYPANGCLVGTTLASNSTITTSDFAIANWGSVEFASRVTLAAFSASAAYSDWALNSSGIANINKTGISKFAIRGAADIDNNTPTLRSYGIGYYADQTGTTNDPKLVVTYAATPTANSNFFAFF